MGTALASRGVICATEGCDRPFYCKGYCTMHYQRLRARGDVGPASRVKAVDGAGFVTEQGYRIVHLPEHPLAGAQGKVREHRVVLWQKIGAGPHPCHWCGVSLDWFERPALRICVDHLDHNRLNNSPDNLVPSCLDCNAKRSA
jgi:hypothetical protein